MLSRMLNWSVVGCGVISENHLDAASKLDDVKIYAVCDIDPERALEKKEKYGAEKMFTDYKEMLKDPKIDVVSICTPSGLHAEIAIDAANAKKHIFCEKPMEITSDRMTAMIDTAERNNIKFGCVFQRRTYPEAVAVKKFIEEHDLGPIIFAEARLKYFRSQQYYDSADWRATWDMDGGGALMNQGVHGIDLLHWFVGDVANVYACCRTLARDIEVEDAAIAVLEFKNGAIGTIRGTTCVYPAQETQISLHFKTGTIILADSGVTVCEFEDKSLKIDDVKGIAGGVANDPSQKGVPSHSALARDLVDAIKEDRPTMIPPREARKSVDLILAIYESSKKRKVIVL